MEDVFPRKQEIEAKLFEEKQRSELIRDSLSKAQQLTDNMVTILSQFDDRLHTLEDTILPVHRKTKDLQRLQDNIEKTTSALDNVIGYHHVVHDVESVLRQGPNRQVEKFLSCMERLEQAITFFSKNNPDSPELNAVSSLFVSGKDSLEKEFKAQLSRQSKLPNAEKIMMLANEEENEAGYGHLPEKTVEDLSRIAHWLVGPGNSRGFLEIFVEIRSNNLVQSVQGLKEFGKNKASGGVSRKQSNAMTTPRKAGNRRASNFARKTSTLLRKESLQNISSVGGMSKSTFSTISEDDVMEIEVEPFIAMLTGYAQLLMIEQTTIQQVLPEKSRRKAFDSVITASMSFLEKSGNKFAQFAKQCMNKHDHPSIVNIFPAMKQLRKMLPLYEDILRASPSNKSVFRTMISDLELIGVKVLEDFTDCVKIDPEKESNMPKDGIVHELTRNTMLFMQQLAQNVEVVGGMLASQQMETSNMSSSGEIYLSKRITDVIAGLKLNLENKSRVYADSSLAAIFLLNNYFFILTALHRHDLLVLVQVSAPNIEKIYNGFINEQKQAYLSCWNKVHNYLNDDNKALANVHPGMKLKDKDKQAVKEKFKLFNNDVEDLVKTHQQWAMANSDMKKEIRALVKHKLVAPYTLFRDKYRMVQFTKNIEKYLKHTPESVSENIDRLFDQCST
uniref:Exocyst complex component 7 n=1 Tax=Phallusia mammillata TaxID=59560 RepID=A0A6F9DCE7_9ASCI|nr:exocyst complex component 7 [Phallusia mammillata]